MSRKVAELYCMLSTLNMVSIAVLLICRTKCMQAWGM